MIVELDTLVDDYLVSTHGLYYDAWAIGEDFWDEEFAKGVTDTAEELRKVRERASDDIDRQRGKEADVLQALLDWLAQIGDEAGGLFGSIAPMISNFTLPGMEGLGELLAGGYTIVMEAINSGIAELGKLLDSASDALAEMIGDIMDFFAELFWNKLAEAL